MEKIYSRKRLIIPKIQFRGLNKPINNNHNNKNNTTIFKLFKTFIIVIIAVGIANKLINSIDETLEIMCTSLAKATATEIVNKEILKIMNEYTYSDISKIDKDENGNVKLIEMNSVLVNKITSSVSVNVQNELNKYEKNYVYIRLGTFTGSKILSGRGPNVPIKITTNGNIETKLISQFSEAGINQTLHRIYLQTSCNVIIMTPYNTIDKNIVCDVLLTEAVIIGDVPETYYNLNGMSSDQLMETIN